MAAWSLEVLPEPMAEVNEWLGSHVEEARLNRWTSVGYVNVLGHSGRHDASSIMLMCTCSSLTPKYDFVRYVARKKVQGLEERRQEHEFLAHSVKRRIRRLFG